MSGQIDEFNLNDEIIEKSKEEGNLFASVTYFRFLKELESVEKKMKEKEPKDYSKDSGIVRFFKKNVVNKQNQKTTESLSVIKQNIINKIDKFKKECSDSGADFSFGEEGTALKGLFDNHFADDRYGMRKRYFAITCAVDSLHEYYEKDAILNCVSELLYGDKAFISDLYAELGNYYKEICQESYKGVEKGILIGVGIASVASMCLIPVIIGATAPASAVLTSCLAQVGRCAPGLVLGGLAKISLNIAMFSTVLFLGAFCGVAIADCIKQSKVNEAFRNLSVNDVKFIFALKATLMQESKKVMDESEFKETMDNALKELSLLRADQEYLYIVEKTNAKDAKEKRKMCNLLIDKYATIVGI